jgi:cobalamin-dependent methionine synthase I
VDVAEFARESASLARFASGCEQVVLLAATVGLNPDRLIQKYGRLSPAKALMMQAIGTERVEALCDAACAHIAAETGLAYCGRFSAGYGDAPLAWQHSIAARLQTAKYIGVTVNDSAVLSPSKSVTAFAGFSANGRVCADKCRACEKQDCAFRGAV